MDVGIDVLVDKGVAVSTGELVNATVSVAAEVSVGTEVSVGSGVVGSIGTAVAVFVGIGVADDAIVGAAIWGASVAQPKLSVASRMSVRMRGMGVV